MGRDLLGVLVTHAALGEELLRTAEGILGPQSDIVVISNAGTSLETLSEKVDSAIAVHREGVIFLFVDLVGGSCSQACLRIRHRHPDTVVFSGVNLPMFLEFLYHRGRVTVTELSERLLAKGREGIQRIR